MSISDEKESLSSIADSLRELSNTMALARRDREFLPLFDRDGTHCGYIEYGTGRMLTVESAGAGWRVELVTPMGERFLGRMLTPVLSQERAMAELEQIKFGLEESGTVIRE